MNEQQRKLLYEALGIGMQGASRLLNKAAGHGVEADDPVLASNFISAVEKLNKNLEKLNKILINLNDSVIENTQMMDDLGGFIADITEEE